MLAALITALVLSTALTGVIVFLVNEQRGSRKDTKEAFLGKEKLSKEHFDLQLRVNVLQDEGRTKDEAILDLNKTLGTEVSARKFLEERYRKLMTDVVACKDTSTLTTSINEDLKTLEQIRAGARPTPAPPVYRPTPPETPSAKTIPIDPALLPKGRP
jgi:cell division protein FtsL